jgi:hypothetical protein
LAAVSRSSASKKGTSRASVGHGLRQLEYHAGILLDGDGAKELPGGRACGPVGRKGETIRRVARL